MIPTGSLIVAFLLAIALPECCVFVAFLVSIPVWMMLKLVLPVEAISSKPGQAGLFESTHRAATAIALLANFALDLWFAWWLLWHLCFTLDTTVRYFLYSAIPIGLCIVHFFFTCVCFRENVLATKATNIKQRDAEN